MCLMLCSGFRRIKTANIRIRSSVEPGPLLRRGHKKYHAMNFSGIVSFLIALLFGNCNSQDSIFGYNSQCRPSYGSSIGSCALLSQCRSVQVSYRFVPPNVCFKDRVRGPVVCCPTANSQQRSSAPSARSGAIRQQQDRISGQKCREFYAPRYRAKRALARSKTFDGGNLHTTIVGGRPTAQNEFTFMVAIGWEIAQNQFDYRCGGSLIEKNYVLTAAHCVQSRQGYPSIVKIGGETLQGPGTSIRISNVYIHPGYNPQNNYNDIALLQLSNYDSAHRPACLWPSAQVNFQEVMALGYGHTQFAGRSSNNLLAASLSLYRNSDCNRYYQGSIIASQVCAGDSQKRRDTCQGDSGGPITIKANAYGASGVPYVVGVTSYGQACANGVPSIYTRVSSFLDWIESIVWQR